MLADGTWTGTYAYDGAGRLNRIPQPGGSDYIAAMTYNARGQAETVSYGNGAVATGLSYLHNRYKAECRGHTLFMLKLLMPTARLLL